jgi:hypothetical protein
MTNIYIFFSIFTTNKRKSLYFTSELCVFLNLVSIAETEWRRMP